MKCHTFIVLIILFALVKVSFETPVANPKAEPCFGFFLGLLAGLFRPFTFGGYGGPLGPAFMNSYPPGVYYGAPYTPYPVYAYPGYPYPGYPYPGYPYPGYPYPGAPVVGGPGGPVNTATTSGPIISIGK